MPDIVAELADRGRSLAPDDRSRLVELLLESLHEPPLSDIEAAWDASFWGHASFCSFWSFWSASGFWRASGVRRASEGFWRASGVMEGFWGQVLLFASSASTMRHVPPAANRV
jgi:hypothetical protein